MAKIYKILFIFTLLLTTFPLKAHVQHYDNLNRIEFDIYRNNKKIGKHIFSFIRDENRLKVESKINLKSTPLSFILNNVSKKRLGFLSYSHRWFHKIIGTSF